MCDRPHHHDGLLEFGERYGWVATRAASQQLRTAICNLTLALYKREVRPIVITSIDREVGDRQVSFSGSYRRPRFPK
jgi:hypothetical protein